MPWGWRQRRQRDVETLTQFGGRIIHGHLVGLGPKVEGIAGAAALEAMEDVLVEVGREGATGGGRGSVQGARAALLGATFAGGLEAEELQHGRHGDGGTNGGEVDGRSWHTGLTRLLVLSLSSVFASFAGLGEFAVALVKDLLVAAIEFVLGRDVADGTMQSNVVVMDDVIGHDPPGVIQRERHADADALALDGFVPAFDLAVGLGIVGGGFDVSHAGDADELFEVLGDELGAIVADDAWLGVGVCFAGALHNGFHVGFLHFLADFLVYDEAAAAIEEGAQKVKGPGDVEVTDIDVPVLVRLQGLDEARAFLGDGGRCPSQESGDFEDAVDAGGAAGDLVGIEHHEGQASVAFERVLTGKDADAFGLVVGEPVVAWHPGIVLVDLAEAVFPVVELAAADADPQEEATDGDVRLVAPGADEINDGVARVVGDPAAG